MKGFDDETKEISPSSGKVINLVEFRQKNVLSTKNNPMCGITFWKWLGILRKYFRYVEWQYLPRALFITILSIVNSLLCTIEHFLYWNRIQEVQLADDPVFIIGHPRTGTTLIHNLLSDDTESFYFCSTFCAGFPSSFLFFERIGKYLFSGIIEKTRPMDSIPLHFDLPQEDECGTNILSGGLSYYMPLWFMKQERLFRKYMNFDVRDGATLEDEKDWCESFLYLLKKLHLRQQYRLRSKNFYENNNISKNLIFSSKIISPRLLLKSPIHTARVPLLLKLFPNAQFIYIHRHPDEILSSAVHMADTAYWYCYMNTPSDKQIMEFIFWQFEQLWMKYDSAVNNNIWKISEFNSDYNQVNLEEKERKIFDNNTIEAKLKNRKKLGNKIEKNIILPWKKVKLENVFERKIIHNVLEVSYDNLTKETYSTIEKIYKFLDMPFTEKQKRKVLQEEKDSKMYIKNVHVPLREDLKLLIRQKWASYFAAFGYE